MEGVACATGLGVVGNSASGIPHSAAAWALATAGKKLKEGRKSLLFFVHRPFLMQACNGLSGYKKSPQAALESFFLLLR